MLNKGRLTMTGRWFVIQFNIKCEDKAARNLRRAGFRPYMPVARFERIHRRTKRTIVKTLPLLGRYMFVWMPPGKYLLQVLYAIGTSYWFMIPLRRLPGALLAGLAFAILVFGEAAVRAAGWGAPDSTPIVAALLLVPGRHGRIVVAYPTAYWLAFMLLGFVFGQWVERRPDAARVRRFVAASGALLLALFAVVRGANGYGNMGLFREGPEVVQWLHVSKYPPSLAFAALELGIASLVLALFFRLERPEAAALVRFLVVFGRTPMLFYLLHIPLLALAAEALGVQGALGLGAAYGFAALAVLVLYPICKWYGVYKSAHPTGIARYV